MISLGKEREREDIILKRWNCVTLAVFLGILLLVYITTECNSAIISIATFPLLSLEVSER